MVTSQRLRPFFMLSMVVTGDVMDASLMLATYSYFHVSFLSLVRPCVGHDVDDVYFDVLI